ncbi:AsmA family protein [Phenylobacterium sp. J367]|uniref:AsmA family protein n=1 Tax=Phenylobacterium sp. J367 TaxID=2898435 RepID=UPI002150B78E|nr:AsmA family protein [Phenylobacterium sp. J367]MCR5880892.1 AsmA family protein [Phenylobacterium sp. J367]
MSNEAFQNPEPGKRRGARRADAGQRRPLQRAGTWTREHWQAARARVAATQIKKPSPKTMKIAGGVLAVIAVAVAILIAIWDWNWFRGPVARYASARMHREVQINGDLDVHLWSWTPSATVRGIRIANPDWAPDKRAMAEIDRIVVQIRLLPLFKGDVDLPLLQFDRPTVRLYADAQGRKTWDFSDGRRPQEPMRLPPIRNFVINDGKIDVREVQRKLTFTGTLNAAERLGGANAGFAMVGQGALNRQPFNLRVTGGPLLNIDKDVPYPFDAYVRAGQTVITARGAVPEPFDLGQFAMNASVRGPDMSDLYGLTGIALPNTPPYNLRGRLVRDGQVYRVTGLNGRVGDSDLAGVVSVDAGRERPYLKADLTTRSLDFDDLGALFGGAPATGAGETASADQAAVARELNAEQRLFPDSTLAVDRIRAMDADATWKIASIRDAPVHLRAASVTMKLDDGLLRADPLRLDLPQGQVTGHVQLNARRATPVTDLDLRLANARVEQLIPIGAKDGPLPLTGSLVGRARLTGEGNSVHKAFANADGEVMVVIPNGDIREAFAELLGVNVVKGLGLLLSKDQDKVPVRCGVAHFTTTDGVMRANRIVFDTKPVVVTGSGTVNLATERMDFRLQGQPKEFRLLRVMLPVTAKGPIRQPSLGVEPGKAIAQGGVAVALGSLLSPLAAILPFVDPGLAKDANCQALLTQASAEGAPVKSARAR